jgi:Tfp pilus assembly protein PilW
MWAAIRRRLRDDEAGLTLIELLVAAAMGVVLMAGVVTVMMGALRAQPKLSEGAANVQTVRFALERITRELRNGFTVGDAKPTTVSFETYVRHSACGSNTLRAATQPSIRCQVRYTCESGRCVRIETAPGVLSGGTPVTVVKGLGTGTEFSYPSATYVKVTLVIPSRGGGSDSTTISDGASLRNATLAN